MRKMVICVALACLACLLATVSPGAEAAKETKKEKAALTGVKGTVYRVNGNKEKESKVTCHPHDVVEIDWTFPIVPPLPSKATQHSSDPAVAKATGIHRILNVGGPLGTGELGGFFRAEQKGKAELTFTIYRGKTETVLKCDVEVK